MIIKKQCTKKEVEACISAEALNTGETICNMHVGGCKM